MVFIVFIYFFSRQKVEHRQMDNSHRHKVVKIQRVNPPPSDYMSLIFPSASGTLTSGKCLG